MLVVPQDESARLAALRRYAILDTPAEPEFDDFTRLAAYICGTPISLLSLVDDQRQWFKSKVGLDVSETPCEVASLTVTAINCTLDLASAAGITDARPGSFIQVEVRDTGTGIPPDVLDRIWQPFFTTKGEGKGTGLGLSTVRGIVESHRGFVAVKTRLGEGTVFTVYLPAAHDVPGFEPGRPSSGGADDVVGITKSPQV